MDTGLTGERIAPRNLMTSTPDHHPAPAAADPQRYTAHGYPAVPPIVHPAAFGASPWPPPAVLGPEMFAELRSLRESVTAVSSKLDGIQGTYERVQDHENRIRALENRRWPIPAAMLVATVAAAGIAAAGAVLTVLVK